MSSQNGAKIYCTVCEVYFNTEADHAMHEFSKKHCDNLLRVSKNKPLKTKAAKNVASKDENDTSVDFVTKPELTGQFSLYGYFNPDETPNHSSGCPPKEYDYSYDPYLQKFAEGPAKGVGLVEPSDLPGGNSTSCNKSKKKKVRSCQICNVTMGTIPEYEAHMKSPQHVWKLKLTGMGVSAHFVKASADLHTTESSELSTSASSPLGVAPAPQPIAPSELFCEICDVLLNSHVQYELHKSGKSHSDKVKLKEVLLAKKLLNQSPSPDQLYCYSCKLTLNDLTQYNAHKNGRKHRVKCKSLVKEGINIPPEERTADMTWAIPDPSRPAVYPDHYTIQSLQIKNPSESLEVKNSKNINPECDNDIDETVESAPNPGDVISETTVNLNSDCSVVKFSCSICDLLFDEQPLFEGHLNSEVHALKMVDCRKRGQAVDELLRKLIEDRRLIIPDRYGRFVCGICAVTSSNSLENKKHLGSVLHRHGEQEYEKKRSFELKAVPTTLDDGSFSCRLCSESWPSLTEYNIHLHMVKHKNLLRQQSNISNSHKRGFPFQPGSKRKEEKNPGIRTKVSGVATDLSSGVVESVPSLEQLEPKIEPTKNVTLGLIDGDNIKSRRLIDNGRRFRGDPQDWRVRPPRFLPYRMPPFIGRPIFPRPRWRPPPPWY